MKWENIYVIILRIEFNNIKAFLNKNYNKENNIRDELDTVKKDVDNIKYRKHKLSLVCMNDITPKVYDEKFRGWMFTFWH